jgi:hypothetical protein
VSVNGSSVGTGLAEAHSPGRLPLLVFTDDFEDNLITPDKWIQFATGLTAEQSSRPWGVRP